MLHTLNMETNIPPHDIPPIPQSTFVRHGRTNLKKYSIVLSLILFEFVLITGSFFAGRQSGKNQVTNKLVETVQPTSTPSQIPTSPMSLETPISVTTLQTVSSTSGWLLYTDTQTGMKIRYPPSVILTKETRDNDLTLHIYSQSLKSIKEAEETGNYSEIPITLGYDSETFLQDVEKVLNGEYGEKIGCGWHGSEKIARVGSLYVKYFDVLACIAAENVILTREAILYPDKNHRIIIDFSGPKNKIMTENPAYFSFGEWKYSSNPDKGYGAESFYQDLVSGNTGPISREWYKTFENILSTITF